MMSTTPALLPVTEQGSAHYFGTNAQALPATADGYVISGVINGNEPMAGADCYSFPLGPDAYRIQLDYPLPPKSGYPYHRLDAGWFNQYNQEGGSWMLTDQVFHLKVWNRGYFWKMPSIPYTVTVTLVHANPPAQPVTPVEPVTPAEPVAPQPVAPVTPKPKPDIQMLAASYDAAINKVKFNYRTNAAGSTKPMSGSFSVGLYQSLDGTFDDKDKKAGPLATVTVSGRTTSGSFNLAGLKLDGASHLFVWADWNLKVGESSGKNNVAGLELPEIQIIKAGFKGSTRAVGFHYTTRAAASASAPLTSNIPVGLFWSKDTTFDSSDRRIATGTVKGAGASATFRLKSDLTPPAGYSYLLVVADPYGKVAESKETATSFQSNNALAFKYSDVVATFSSKTGELSVTGSNKDNTIIVRQDNNRISVEGTTLFVSDGKGDWVSSVWASGMRKIKVDALAGRDTIRLDKGTQPIDITSYLFGGAGNDTIYGGNGFDQIHGGSDDDRLFGGGGDDALWGDAGNDWLEAGSAKEVNVFFGPAGEKDWNAHMWAVNGASAGDFAQGYRGNCFFLAPLASLTYRGVNLQDRIRYKGDYWYEVKLFDAKTNQWSWIPIRFEGTVAATDPQPTTTGEFWPVLYRRAFLKMTGILDEGGLAGDGLTALTGRPSTWVPNTANEALFARLERDLSQGRHVVASSKRQEFISSPNLVGPHAYVVLSVQRRDGKPFSVNLWNPHGYQLAVSWVAFSKDMQGFHVN